jgi:hypothetical protein
MPLGTSQQLTATGSYTDGSTQDLTSAVRWASASNGVVDVSDGGEAVAKSMGTSLVSAISGGIEGKELLSVTPAALVTITVSPSGPTLLVGDNLQLKATGTFTDASTQDLTKTATWSLDNNTVASINGGGDVWAAQVGVATAEATLAQVQGSTTVLVHPVAAVNYFHVEPYGADTTFRLTDPGGDLPALCAMLYVFDQDQQMAECCGCRIGRDGLRTLSLNKDLVSNPLTDRAPVSGSIFLITAAYAGNSSCDASSITPNGMAVAWATHLQAAATPNVATTEETLSRVPLSDTLSSAIQTQCSFVQQLGGGHGICSCGDGH